MIETFNPKNINKDIKVVVRKHFDSLDIACCGVPCDVEILIAEEYAEGHYHQVANYRNYRRADCLDKVDGFIDGLRLASKDRKIVLIYQSVADR